MKLGILALAAIGLFVFCNVAEAGNRNTNAVQTRKACTQGVSSKIKAGQLKKSDYNSEVNKCIADPASYL